MTKVEPTPVADTPHPVVWFAQRAHEVLDEVLAGGVHVASLAPGPTGDTVGSLLKLADRITATAMSLLPHADTVDVAATVSPVATSTGAWLAHTATVPQGQARRLVKAAKRLETAYSATRDAALAGGVSPAQVEVIVSALDDLPVWVDPEERVRAEEHLIGLAAQHDAKKLRVLAKHLLHVIDPDAADTELARRLETEEAAAARKTFLKLFDDGNGTCHGSFRIPALHGAMLTVALEALASPKLPNPIRREEPTDPHRTPGDTVAEVRTAPHPRCSARRSASCWNGSDQEAPQDRWWAGHRAGHHLPRGPRGPPRGCEAVHRRADQRGRCPEVGLSPRPDRPSPGRQVRTLGPVPPDPAAHRVPTHRNGHA